MAEITKEKILELASEAIADGSTFECIGDDAWLKAVLFYNTGINDFARMIIQRLVENNG